MPRPPCPRCGEPVPASKGRKPRRWCSESCRVRAWEERVGRTSNWPRCVVSFPTCLICRATFAARAGGRGNTRSTCSSSCHRAWRVLAERARRAALDGERLAALQSRRAFRRAATSGALAEQFDRREVFERDGWVCGICTDPVDRQLRWPDPQCASLDHVIPLSRGGPHTRANTRCSHLICNIRRGNRDVLPA